MLVSRNGRAPVVQPAAPIAASAQAIGDVAIGAVFDVSANDQAALHPGVRAAPLAEVRAWRDEPLA